jgi:uncharacterized Tic20 family protein
MPGGSDYTPPPSSGAGGYAPPPSSGAGGYAPPPSSGAGYQPTSGAGGYTPPPSSGAGGYPTYPSQEQGYGQPPQAGYGQPPQAGYGQPPQAGYGVQPGAYGQPGGYGGPPPAGYPTNDDKTYAMIAHWGGVAGVVIGGGFLGWVGPLIAYVAKGQQSPVVRAHAVTSLNFHITWAIAYAVSFILLFVSCGLLFFVPLLVWLVPLIFGIIGGVKATSGEFYRYPMTINMIK